MGIAVAFHDPVAIVPTVTILAEPGQVDRAVFSTLPRFRSLLVMALQVGAVAADPEPMEDRTWRAVDVFPASRAVTLLAFRIIISPMVVIGSAKPDEGGAHA